MTESYHHFKIESTGHGEALPGVPLDGRKVGSGKGSSLPCLNSNNAVPVRSFSPSALGKTIEALEASGLTLTPYHKKAAFALTNNVDRFIWQVRVNRVGFLTLTFLEDVTDHKEAVRRFRLLVRYKFPKVFGPDFIRVSELHHSARIGFHFHVLVDCRQDIRTGVNFDEIYGANGRRPRYSSASPYLRSIWEYLRQVLPGSGFGRFELLPIKSTPQAMAKYIGKYLSKGNLERPERLKGVRLVGYSKDFVHSSPSIAWNSPGAAEWRRKLAKFAALVGCGGLADLTEQFGSKWAFRLRDHIDQVDSLTPMDAQKIVWTAKEYVNPLPVSWKPRLSGFVHYVFREPSKKPEKSFPLKPISAKPRPLSVSLDEESGVLVDNLTGEVLF